MKCKVVTTDYYGEFEDAPPLKWKEGQKIKVHFRNGKTSIERLRIKQGSGSAQVDMNNHPDHFTTQTFFFWIRLHGRGVKVPLRGLFIEPIKQKRKSNL